MNTQLYVGRYEKARGEYLGGSRVRYTWPCGHQHSEIVMVGPKGRGSRGLRRPMAPELVQKLARYWGERSDGSPHYGLNAGPCPTCVKIAKRTDPSLIRHLKPRRG